jgi:hypothetical protein
MSRLPRRSSIIRGAPVLGAVGLLGSLTWPLLFTYSGFAGDWDHHLWLMWHQSLSLQSNHFPSYFLNSSYSVFYPTYAFYGGTLYAVGGLLSLALGGAPVQAYVLIYVLDFVAAFGGWYWLGRMAGLNRRSAIVPGLVFVTSAYYILVIYVQGDWPEFTGISMIPLLIAAGLSVLHAERLRTGSALALAASSVLFFGSHNLTILLGLTTLAITSLAVLICVPNARQSITRKGLVRVASLVVPSALVSAWYLLPTLAYHSSTRIAGEYIEAREELRGNLSLISIPHLFTFSRTTGPGMSLPVLAIVWVLAGIVVLPLGSRPRTWVRLLLICSGMALLIAIAMRHVGLLLALPRPYTLIQYSYRLEAYVLLALCGAILAALVLAGGWSPRAHAPAQRRVRVWRWMALPVCAVSLGGAIQQISAFPDPGQDRYTTLEYYGEVETGNNRDFQDVAQRVIPGHGLAAVDIPPAAIQADRVSFSTRQRPGTLIATNIGAGPNMVHVTGARAVGVDSETGDMVLQIASPKLAGAGRAGTTQASDTPTPTDTISVSTADNLPIVLGRILTCIGLAALVLQLLALPAHRLLFRRVRAGSGPQVDAQREAVDRGLL